MYFLFCSMHMCTTRRIYDKEIIVKVLQEILVRCDLYTIRFDD